MAGPLNAAMTGSGGCIDRVQHAVQRVPEALAVDLVEVRARTEADALAGDDHSAGTGRDGRLDGVAQQPAVLGVQGVTSFGTSMRSRTTRSYAVEVIIAIRP